MDSLVQLTTALAGRYAIDREIGRGGMATVYLARDVRHDRSVALKVLSPELGAVLGVERFLSEIKVTANLQHPNLLPLFDSGEADGLLFYVMPFVDGESLRSRLAREKQLPVDEAIRLATAVASALDYAHRHGVIHRDLKPENILLHEGQPLVADFGIALAVSNAGGNRITQTGLSLGTPQYMSPEQATGDRAIDGRTDIYSLGAVLYEMLAGDPPHVGSTSQAIIARLLTDKPRSVRATRATVPMHVDAAVERALEKLPADRFATAHEFADALSGKLLATPSIASASPSSPGTFVTPLTPTQTPRRLGRRDVVYGALLAGALGVGAVQWVAAHRPDASPVVRFQLLLPKDHRLNDALIGTIAAVSPRGDRIAYTAISATSGGNILWLRATDRLESKALTTAGAAVRTPCFSPDGNWVAFTDGNDIKKVSVDGGPVIPLGVIPDTPRGLNWGANGIIVVGSASSGLFVIGERGGPARLIQKAAEEGQNQYPLVLPDGNMVVYASVSSGGATAARLAMVSLADGRRTILDVPGTAPLAFLNGQLVYATQAGFLMAVPLDLRRRAATGPPTPVAQDVVMDPSGGAKAAVSASGALVYRSGKSENQPVLAGKGSPLITEAHDFSTPRFSPDGGRIAFTITSPQAMDIWVYDRVRTTLTRVTSEGTNQRPEWTPDGKRVVFVSDRGGRSAYWWQPADGGGPAELLYNPPQGDPFEGVLSPDGRWLVYRTGPAGKPPRSIFAVPLDARDRKSIPIVTGKSYIQMPRLSPDGRWLAYQSNESNTFEIYVRPFPGPGGRVQVSAGGGSEPLWARSGRVLYYRRGQELVRVSVTTGATFGIGDRKTVLTGDYLTNPSHPNYDVLPDGSDFLMIRRAGDEVQTIVVQNFGREVAARTTGQR
jgi:serine/threonine-protein kinase